MESSANVYLDQKAYQIAQVYAKQANKSISEFVNELINSLEEQKKFDEWYDSLGPITKKLVGALKTSNESIGDPKLEYLKRKYS